jgi:two-component system, OmpR family, response regulator ChvI
MMNEKRKRTERILVVDDEPDIASLLKMALEHEGSFNNVQTFDDPLLALSNFKADLYDLVILDIIMPKIDGFDLYQEMIKIDNKVKFCFLTGSETYREELEKYHSLNEDMVIRKPIPIKDLLMEINKNWI